MSKNFGQNLNKLIMDNLFWRPFSFLAIVINDCDEQEPRVLTNSYLSQKALAKKSTFVTSAMHDD